MLSANLEYTQSLKERAANAKNLSKEELLTLKTEIAEFSTRVSSANAAITQSLSEFETVAIPALHQAAADFQNSMTSIDDEEDERLALITTWAHKKVHEEGDNEPTVVGRLHLILRKANPQKCLDIVVQLSQSWEDPAIAEIARTYYSEEFRSLTGQAKVEAENALYKDIVDPLVFKELPLLCETTMYVSLEDPSILLFLASVDD
jgi:hypothetical protein